MKRSSVSLEASPYKSVADELDLFRKAFRALVQRYTTHVEAEIAGLRERVLAAAEKAPLENGEDSAPKEELAPEKTRHRKDNAAASERQADQIRDLRDMLTLLRTFELDRDVVKRRDFKQIESLLAEVQELTRRWA